MKKRVAQGIAVLLLAACCVGGVHMAAYAEDNAIVAQPCATGAYHAGCSLSITAGTATCQGYITPKPDYTASSTLLLQQSANETTWTTLQTWNGSGTIADKTYAVSPGRQYRAIFYAELYNADGVMVDHVTKISICTYDAGERILGARADFSDIVGRKASTDHGQIYVLGNDLSVYRIAADGQHAALYSVADVLGTEAVLDFKVIDGTVYVSVSEPDGVKTYQFPPDYTAASADRVTVIDGNVVDGGTYYQSTLVPEGEYNCGHTCIVTILQADGTVKDSITLYSDKLIVGAQYLGTDADGNYRIKQYDMDLTDKVEQTIRTIDRNHKVIGCTPVSDADT